MTELPLLLPQSISEDFTRTGKVQDRHRHLFSIGGEGRQTLTGFERPDFNVIGTGSIEDRNRQQLSVG